MKDGSMDRRSCVKRKRVKLLYKLMQDFPQSLDTTTFPESRSHFSLTTLIASARLVRLVRLHNESGGSR